MTVVAAASMLLLGGTTPGAAAATASSDQERPSKAGFVDAPAAVPVGWEGPLTVGWLNSARTQRFTVRVEATDAGASYEVERHFRIKQDTSVRRPVVIDPVATAGGYRASFFGEDGSVPIDTHDFRATVPVDLEVAGSPPASFLPRVRDGIRDTATLRYTVDRPSHVTGRVLDRRGRVLQVLDLGRRDPGTEHAWTWFGNARGATVERGRYRMRVTARADGLETVEERDVRVASYTVPLDRRARRLGVATASRAPGGCALSPHGAGALEIDCRDAGVGEGAEVTYRFAPGASARGLQWLMTGDGSAQRSSRRAGDGLVVTLRVNRGVRWRVEDIAAAWRTRVQR